MEVILLFAAAALLCFVLCRVLIRFAGALSAGAQPKLNQTRWSASGKPLVGGVALYIVFLLTALAAELLFRQYYRTDSPQFAHWVGAGTLAFLIGLADDAYGTRPLAKLAGQLLCGAWVALAFPIDFFGVAEADFALTMFWVVGLMNSVNLLDNMDAAAGTVAFVACLVAGASLFFKGMIETPQGYAAVGLAGGLAGFLALNRRPAKLYMGDAGSMFLGLLLALFGIFVFWNAPELQQRGPAPQMLAPVLLLLPPIIDTTFVTVARLARGQSPAVGGRDHTTHHLVYAGVPEGWVPVVLGAGAAVSGFLALAPVHVIADWTMLHTLAYAGYLAAYALFFVWFYRKGARLKPREARPAPARHSRETARQEPARRGW